MKSLYFTFESQNVFELSQTHIHSIQDKDNDRLEVPAKLPLNIGHTF